MRHLSPRDLADALGVSESSLKRWVDAGKIAAFRTEGGHRRILVAEAVRFIRDSGTPVARPELLGLPEIATPQRAATSTELLPFLLEGDVTGARAFLLTRYLAGTSIAELADGPNRAAMHALGELWRHEESGIFVEHRGTDTCLQAISYLRHMIDAPANAPLAIGAGPEDDPYMIAPVLAAMVTTVAGFRTVNLGPDTPLAALQAAVAHHRPRLVWISASTPINPSRARSIARWLATLDTLTIVGGRHGSILADAPNVRYLDTMTDLAAAAARIV
jgi:excisionase family DNA binding protein